jgi:hypothetical protein
MSKRIAFFDPVEGRASIYYDKKPVYALQHDSPEPTRITDGTMRLWIGNEHVQIKEIRECFPFSGLQRDLKVAREKWLAEHAPAAAA